VQGAHRLHSLSVRRPYLGLEGVDLRQPVAARYAGVIQTMLLEPGAVVAAMEDPYDKVLGEVLRRLVVPWVRLDAVEADDRVEPVGAIAHVVLELREVPGLAEAERVELRRHRG